MKIVSWNVNGIRAVHRKDNLKDVFALKPDILGIQETKAQPDQLGFDITQIDDYKSDFFSAEKKGYSGVAMYSKNTPKKIYHGMNIKKFDGEGRTLIAEFATFTFITCYFPNGKRSDERLKFKMDFYDEFLKYVNKRVKKGEKVIFCGDVNTAHKEIDLSRPKENQKVSGFLPEERVWIDKVISTGWIDTFRHFYPEKADIYSWWDMQSRARDRNKGWRIDYFFVSQNLRDNLKNAHIHTDIFGSDHCPVSIEIDL